MSFENVRIILITLLQMRFDLNFFKDYVALKILVKWIISGKFLFDYLFTSARLCMYMYGTSWSHSNLGVVGGWGYYNFLAKNGPYYYFAFYYFGF